MEEEHTKGPSHNNPKEAATYVRSVNSLTDSFDTSIHSFDRYLRLDAGRLSYTHYPSFSSTWTAHISPSWTPMSYSIPYQTKPVTLSLHALRKQQSEYSNVFPVTKFQMVLKLCPKYTYKIYHVSIEKDNKLSPNYLVTFKTPTTTWQK